MLLVPEVQHIHDNLSAQDREIFDALVGIAGRVDPAFQNGMQWKVPTFTLNDNRHHWIFSLARTRKGLTLTFHKGWLLDDPEKALSGEGSHLRMLRFTEVGGIRQSIVEGLIRSAILHQVDM